MQSSTPRTASRFAAGLSTNDSFDAAFEEVVAQALGALEGPPHLAFVFASPHHAEELDGAADRLADALGTDSLVGCTGESIVGLDREIEQSPALSVWVASLPGAEIDSMHLRFERTADGGTLVGWPDALGGDWPEDASLLVLGEPFTFPAELLLERTNEDRPGIPVIGGMASGAASPGENRLLLGRRTLRDGAVAVRISGGPRLTTLVSQGCRPIGKPFVVTRAERNVIYQLGGKPALDQLRELFHELPNHEQRMVQQGLHVGRVVSEYQDHFEQGDFLVRNVLAIQPNDGAVAIGDYVRAGQTVQFHIRDAQTADQELREMLARLAREPELVPRGALLFTCNGRGSRLFEQPHHDAGCIRGALGDIPLAGFFAQGEMGPVARQNFLHGFTASVAVFSDPAHQEDPLREQ